MVRPPPEPMVLVLRYAIQHRPSITELIQPKVKWLTWIKTIWTLVHVYEYLSRGHCWVVTGISYSLFHLVTVIYDLLNEDVMRPNQLFLLCSALSTSGTVTPFAHLQISMKRPQTYLPEHYDYHYVHRYYTMYRYQKICQVYNFVSLYTLGPQYPLK